MDDKKRIIVISAIVQGLRCLEEVGLGFFNLFEDDNESDSDAIQRHQRKRVLRIKYYVDKIVPGLQEKQFQEHFRLSRKAFELLLQIIAEKLKRKSDKGRLPADPKRQLLSVLWILATPDSYRSVAERFDMGKSSLSDAFVSVVKALCNLAPKVIVWPNQDERERQKRLFRAMGGLDGVVGAVDGTLVPMKAPKEDPEAYRTRKCNYAMTLQGICNAQLKFTHCFVGYPGSVSDRRIFENSDIYVRVMENHDDWFTGNQFILGDKAYPVLQWCIPPYIDRGNLTAAQRNFNQRHAQTRSTIERSFALLFGRLRRLKFLDMNRLDLILNTILASCVIHNLCIDFDGLENVRDYINEGEVFENDTEEAENMGTRFQRRNNIGEIFRNYLCESIIQ